MTKYTLTIITSLSGVNVSFEFDERAYRETFLAMFINNLKNDYVTKIVFGERTFAK